MLEVLEKINQNERLTSLVMFVIDVFIVWMVFRGGVLVGNHIATDPGIQQVIANGKSTAVFEIEFILFAVLFAGVERLSYKILG